jgi:integral membrane protein
VLLDTRDPAELRRYQIMAWIVGSLLIVLVLVGVPLKYLTMEGSSPQHVGELITTYLGIAHGWLYMIFLVTAALLARSQRWGPAFTITTLLAGTVPIVSFWAERRATAVVRAASG